MARRHAAAAGNDSVGETAPSRWAPSPDAHARASSLLVALAGVLLAVLTSWPLVLHLPSRIAPDLGDPVRTAWEIAWVGHAMLHDPLHLFDSNAFYPHPLSLAFSDSLLGYGPTAFFGSGTVAALVRYNLLFLFAWSLCFVGAYLLARELGPRPLAGAAAGVAFAYAPYRVTEAGHLHVISSGGLRAGAVPAPARLPALLARARARRLARVGLAGQPRLHARAAVLLPARGARADRARVLVARAPDPRRRMAGDRRALARTADPPPAARGHADRHRRARRGRASTRRART